MGCLDNGKLIKSFITQDESRFIIQWIDGIQQDGDVGNYHLKKLSDELKGKSYTFDISNTPLTNYITEYQKIFNVSRDKLPNLIYDVIDRVSEIFDFPKDNIFLQVVDMGKGGKIHPHYDVSIKDYITYKCNISLLSDDYNFYVDKEILKIEEGDLYGFEASLYKHWTDEFLSRRVFLSIGFVLPYEKLGRNKNEPRIRMSERIQRYFQK